MKQNDDKDRYRALLGHSSLPDVAVTDKTRGHSLSRNRILLADDNTAILDHVSDMLQAEYEIIGKVADGNSVTTEVERLRPDLVILDISMGDRSGIEIAKRLREQGYAGKIVFLTVHEDPDFVTAALGAGGRGYVIKSRLNLDLKLAVQIVLAHGMFISSSLQDE
jgi:DNA-binding NarL/FixJ family response regulator